MTDAKVCLRRILVHKSYDGLRHLALGHVGNRQHRHLPFFPIAEHFPQQGQHHGLVEISRDPQDHAVRMNRLPVKGDQIVSGDAGDGLDAAFTRRRMVRSVQELQKLAADDRTGVILPATNTFDSLQLGQFNPCRFKGGCLNQSLENLEPALHILAEYIERCRPGLPPDRDADIPGKLFEFFVDLLGRQPAAAAGPHDGTGQRSQADLICRVEPTARSYGRSHIDQRQLMVFKEIDDHPVLEHHAIRFGRGELNGWKRHLPWVAQCNMSGTAGQHRDREHDDDRAQHETPSCHLLRVTYYASHRATSVGSALTTCLSPAFFTNVATVRFDLVKYSAATRWISAGLTVAILSRALTT